MGLALCLLATLAVQGPAPGPAPAEVVLRADGGDAPSWSLEHEVERDGHLYVWCVADGHALSLRVEAVGADAATEQRSAPGVPALVSAQVVDGQAWRVRVSAPDAAGEVDARVRLARSYETDATREAAEAAREALREASELVRSGDGPGARALLRELVVELEAVEGHDASRSVANLLFDAGAFARRVGELELAERLLTGAVDFARARFPATNRWLLAARMNRGITLRAGGRLDAAREEFEACLATFLSFLPPDHDDVVRTRANLSSLLSILGEHSAARAMLERVIAAWSARLPEDHPDLIKARETLAVFVMREGDLAGAQEIGERCLELYRRALPDNDPAVLLARANLSSVFRERGDLERALALQLRALEDARASLPEDSQTVVSAKEQMGLTLLTMERYEEALVMAEEVLAARTAGLPADHPRLEDARNNLALVYSGLGRNAEALELHQRNLAARLARLPEHHPQIFASRVNALWCLSHVGERDAVRAACLELAEYTTRALQAAAATRSPREVEALAAKLRMSCNTVLSIAAGARGMEPFPELDAAAFALVESMRGAGLRSARVLAEARADPRLAGLREAAREAAGAVARRTERGGREGYIEAVIARDAAQKELLEHLGGRAASADGEQVGAGAVAARLGARDAAIAYSRYDLDETGAAGPLSTRRPVLAAFVVRPGRPLLRVELGPLDEVDRAVEDWRRAVGAAGLAPAARSAPQGGRGTGLEPAPAPASYVGAGERLRALVVDPLLPALEGARTWTVVPDSALHGIAFDALPGEDEGAVLGDAIAVRIRTTLWELCEERDPAPASGLLAIAGEIDYGALATAAGERPAGALAEHVRAGRRALFEPLPFTAGEVDRIAALAHAGERDVLRLTGADATREALWDAAPRAAWLHLATHGYFAPDTVRALDGAGPAGVEVDVRGISPMALCGLALAGANVEPDAFDRVRGVVTAEELATFDLSACELAVLSACETHVGVRRAGQGLASLQLALHMAGARSVITSLWKVPDEATAELMVDFYRRLWEDGETKHRALWLAKQQLREAGRPPRDWAGWILTGDPD